MVTIRLYINKLKRIKRSGGILHSYHGTLFSKTFQRFIICYWISLRPVKGDMVKHCELRVRSCELQITKSSKVTRSKARVEGLKARVEFQTCEFKSTSYEFESTSYGFNSTNH